MVRRALFLGLLLGPLTVVLHYATDLGATAEFITGAQVRAPAIMTKTGFEWLHRLAQDPKRMFGRYLIGNPLFLTRILRARLGR